MNCFLKAGFLSALLSFIFITNIIAKPTGQTVYFAEEPLPKIVKKLRESGMSEKNIIPHLKNTLPQVTPELAKNKFDIIWIDNDPNLISYKNQIEEYNRKYAAKYCSRVYKNPKETCLPNPGKWNGEYPALVISYIDPKIGYALFTLDEIKIGQVVVEYTGKYDTEGKNKGDYSLLIGETFEDMYNCPSSNNQIVNANHHGNAARFALYAPSKETLDYYGYKNSKGEKLSATEEITIANITDFPIGDCNDMHSIFLALRNIKPFEQIGFDYSETYGYEYQKIIKNENSGWAYEPYLFTNDGDLIAPKDQLTDNFGITFNNSIADNQSLRVTCNKNRAKMVVGIWLQNKTNPEAELTESESIDLLGIGVNTKIFDGYLVFYFNNGDNGIFVIDSDTVRNAIFNQEGRTRLTFNGYLINPTTNLKQFIGILKRIKHERIAPETKNEIITYAIRNQANEVDILLKQQADILKYNAAITAVTDPLKPKSWSSDL